MPVMEKSVIPTNICRELLGDRITLVNDFVRPKELKSTYIIVPNGLESKELDKNATSYILYICGNVLFPSSKVNKVAAIYLQLLRPIFLGSSLPRLFTIPSKFREWMKI